MSTSSITAYTGDISTERKDLNTSSFTGQQWCFHNVIIVNFHHTTALRDVRSVAWERNKISRLTARLGISKILAGLKSDIRGGGSTLGDARVKVKNRKKEKKKHSRASDRHTLQHTWHDWQADRSWAARQTASFPLDWKQHSHTRAHSCLPDRMLCTSCALNSFVHRRSFWTLCAPNCPRADFVFAGCPLVVLWIAPWCRDRGVISCALSKKHNITLSDAPEVRLLMQRQAEDAGACPPQFDWHAGCY